MEPGLAPAPLVRKKIKMTTTGASTATQLTEQYRKLMEAAGDFDGASKLFAEKGIIDANVPGWRFQRQGPKQIAEQFKEWYGDTLPRVVEWRVLQTPWGALVEGAEEMREGADKLYSRYAYIR